MTMDEPQPKLGLRERKKLKTRASIQQHALRLIREQGYQATTIEQIAEAAEVSPSTFFRYFPTKEAIILEDDYDPLLIAAFQKQPRDLTPLQALRRAITEGLAMIPEEERDSFRDRMALTMSVPELRAATVNQLTNTLQMLSEVVAARTERSPGDLEVLSLAGAVMGAFLSVQAYCTQHPEADFMETLDRVMGHLEAGLPFDP